MELDQEHSRLGIASFSIFLAGIIIDAVVILIAVIEGMGHMVPAATSAHYPNPIDNWLNGGIIFGFCLNLVAFGSGIAGLFQQGSKKTLAIAGTALSGMIVLPAFV